MDNIHNNGITW